MMRRRFDVKEEAGEELQELLKGDRTHSVSQKSIDNPPPVIKVFGICLVFRIANALLIHTYFNPDEHWQSLEVAHRIVFGYGHMTWEWSAGIRSYLHPLIFAFFYKLLWFFNLDTPSMMVMAPRVYQSFFAAIGDAYFYRLSYSIFDKQTADWALLSQLTNWFMFYCITRTLSNSLEAVLTIMAIYYWPSLKCSQSPPYELRRTSRKVALVLAAFACAIRPTSAVIWIYLGTLHLFETRDKVKFVFMEVSPIGASVLALACLFDRWMYGSWVFVPLNFVKFNFFSSGGDYYGTHKWHWYFSQGFPTMLFTFAPFTTIGIWQSKEWKLFGLIAWVLGVYSILGHKEFRFVLPVLPIALLFSGYTLAKIGKCHSVELNCKGIGRTKQAHDFKKKWAILFLLLSNLPMAFYMSMIHQRGSEDAMAFLAREAAIGKVHSVLFLMPCHSTPYYSTLHRNISMRFLDCSPSAEEGYVDESDSFLLDPAKFTSLMALDWKQPSHILLFDSQERHLKDFLTSHSYKEIRRFFHAHFKVDRDLQAAVLVYALVEC
ncbi:mannosyltransferase APTG1 isoform X2 [Nymphaea colorata]|uniref:mannosyltransferase APTG1 isoform X2 n=1 Tax=Nymphaea colorata TaxID=210225 RepID=UPI00129E4D45|nr:mannosyltransferase APTG1 isoform X2 [Nymphaea colorata]XP_049932427.1 mannosyltransferase APTG1 isoform X2 [Nymphaea colorata]XP_049932428.1 mannosyltransferase APTG1 isoform X2 [Nymphaea colorata]